MTFKKVLFITVAAAAGAFAGAAAANQLVPTTQAYKAQIQYGVALLGQAAGIYFATR